MLNGRLLSGMEAARQREGAQMEKGRNDVAGEIQAAREGKQKFINDTVGYMMKLRKMAPDEKMKVYPQIRAQVVHNTPEMADLFPKDRPPTAGEIDNLLGPVADNEARNKLMKDPQVALSYLKTKTGVPELVAKDNDQVDMGGYGEITDEEGNKLTIRRPPAPDGSDESGLNKLSPKLVAKYQEKLIDATTDVGTLENIYKNFDLNAFTYQGKFVETVGEIVDTFGLASEKQTKMLQSRLQQRQQIEQMMLIWRKYITGVAGGEKEMERIESTTLNMHLSPAQAQGALELLTRKVLVNRETYTNLLNSGNVLEVLGKKKYSEKFRAKRESINSQFDNYIKKFKKYNPSATDIDALLFRAYKMQQQ